jgi:hypothetical protein
MGPIEMRRSPSSPVNAFTGEAYHGTNALMFGLDPRAIVSGDPSWALMAGLEKLAPHDMRRTSAKLCRKRGGDLEQIKIPAGACVDSDHGAVFGSGAGFHLCRE